MANGGDPNSNATAVALRSEGICWFLRDSFSVDTLAHASREEEQ